MYIRGDLPNPYYIQFMKNYLKLLAACAIVAGLAACEKSTPEPEETNVIIAEEEWSDTVTISFSRMDVQTEPMKTRAATSIGDYTTHLDVWLSDGETTADYHQSSTDADYGTITAVVDKRKTYTLYAVAHKCDGDATLSDGVIAFPADKVTQSLYYQTTFSPATTTEISAEMQRIVGCFRLEITDDVPATVKKMRFTLSGVYDRWNVTSGGTHQLDRVSTINYGGTSSIFNVYAIVTDTETTHTATIEALDANDAVVQTRVFSGVTLRNGYRTTYRGAFFIDQGFSATFTAQDWTDYDPVTF